MWRCLVVIALILCLAALVGCGGGGLNLGGNTDQGTAPVDNGTVIPPPTPVPPSDGPPAPPIF